MRLIQGNCLEVLKTLPDGCVDAVVTDPPYGRNQEWHHGRNGNERAYRVEMDNSLEVARFARQWAADRDIPFLTFMSPYLQLPGPWQQLLVWDKGGAVGGGGDVERTLKQTWELIGVERARLHAGRRSAVLTHHITPQSYEYHRCQKPLWLMRELIRCFVPPGATILDPFMGSGTTGVACVREGRDFIGIEINPDYFAIAKRRIEEAEAHRNGTAGELFAKASLFDSTDDERVS